MNKNPLIIDLSENTEMDTGFEKVLIFKTIKRLV